MAVTSPAGSVGVTRADNDRHPSAWQALRQVTVLAASTGLTVVALVGISTLMGRWG